MFVLIPVKLFCAKVVKVRVIFFILTVTMSSDRVKS